MGVTISHPSQGLRRYLDVHERTIEHKLSAIKAARSDLELKALLLDLTQKVFQVWSTTFRFNETSTTSNSHPDGSSDSWERISGHISTSRRSSPKSSPKSMFPNLERGNQRRFSTPSSNPASQGTPMSATMLSPQSMVNASTNIPVAQNSLQNIAYSPSQQNGVGLSDNFNLVDVLGSQIHTFPPTVYPSNIHDEGGGPWMSHMQMEQLQFNNGTVNYDDVNMGGDMHANNFEMVSTTPDTLASMQIPRWGDGYPLSRFGRYHEGS